MAYEYNPLLPLNLQKKTDISTIQAEIDAMQENLNALQTSLNALQNQKITKCFTAADLAKIVDNEIFEWQGASGTVDETAFVNGFFYKKTVTKNILQAPVNGVNVIEAGYSYNNIQYKNGNYYADTISNIFSLSVPYTLYHFNVSSALLWIVIPSSDNVLTVGNVFRYVVNGVCTQQILSSYSGKSGNFQFSFESGLILNTTGFGFYDLDSAKKLVDVNGNNYYFGVLASSPDQGSCFLTLDNNYNIIDYSPCECLFMTFNYNVTVNYSNFTPTDTQSRILLPVGLILPYGGSSAPAGFLICDGSAISRSDYYALFSVIGTVFGSGDGSTTFNIPDLRETLPVGAGTSTNSNIANHDSYNVGEFKDDQYQGHMHQDYINGDTRFPLKGRNDGIPPVSGEGWSVSALIGEFDIFGATSNGRSGSTTHGKQLGVTYIIKT